MQYYDRLYKNDLVEMIDNVDILVEGYFYVIDDILEDENLIISGINVPFNSVKKVIESISIGLEYNNIGDELDHIKIEFPSNNYKTEYLTKEREHTRKEHNKYMISRGKENVYRNKSKLGIARQKFCFMSGFIHKGNVYRLKVSNDNNLVA